ncbi:MAG: hypothetical protein K2Q10_12180 [Rhodospirillales bacterium]|nr:hypothetical protein [Rhodospirillales bacterium]
MKVFKKILICTLLLAAAIPAKASEQKLEFSRDLTNVEWRALLRSYLSFAPTGDVARAYKAKNIRLLKKFRDNAAAVRFDINGDGRMDMIAGMMDFESCGSAGCWAYIFLGKKEGFKAFEDFGYTHDNAITLTGERINGWATIRTDEATYRWLGRQYDFIPGPNYKD